MQFASNQFRIPEVTKNLVFINVLIFIASNFIGINDWMYTNLSLFHWQSPLFKPWQLVTHMFMHGQAAYGGFSHIFFNMFGLWIFGSRLEQVWGAKRFLNFYLLSGVGAALLHLGVLTFELNSGMAPINSSMVGASGALFGLLAGFAFYWPNTELYLFLLPIPIKAKYFVLGYALIDLFSGIAQISDGIAHFAHVGGAVVGFLLVYFWNKRNRNTFY